MAQGGRDGASAAFGAEVHVCSMRGMGHCWPGPACSLGTANMDIAATDAMWEFFNRFRLPASP
jgi:poly(3-hydroxybutyrate) depolymerase